MKKFTAVLLTLLLVAVLIACGGCTPGSSGGGSTNADSAGKIAVIRNMSNSDHTAQFFAGCVSEGEALGYQVDTFMSDGDDVIMQDLMEQALEKDYDIWIISHANEGYQFDIISRAVDKGIFVVGFDCGGAPVPGVTYTSQDDIALATLSLDGMLEGASEVLGAGQPFKFAEINILGMIVPFDTRHAVIEEYIAAGKLDPLDIISPNLTGDVYAQIYTATTNILNNNPGPLGVWAASSGLLDGAMDAIDDSGRDNVIVTAVDIANTELARMAAKPYYYCCAAVDPFVIGMVDVRLAVLKQLGVATPDIYRLDAVNIYGSQIKATDSMANLGDYFPDFGWTEAFNTPEIIAQREKYAS